MNSIILCEGKTENIVLDAYLMRSQGWLEYKIENTLINEYFNIDVDWADRKLFTKEDKKLFRFSISGTGNLKKAIDIILMFNMNQLDEKEIIHKIVIIRDSDDKQIDKRIQSFNDTFNRKGYQGSIENTEWVNFTYQEVVGNNSRSISVLPLIIPPDESGAMETFLINCIRFQDEKIVTQCENFIENFEPQNYFKNSGERLKSKFWTTMAVKYPRRQLYDSFKFLKSIEWEEYDGFIDGFKELSKI